MKILHSADWHLDSPLLANREDLRKYLLSVPEKLVELVHRHGCDLVLLSGDLFDAQPTKETLNSVKNALEQIRVPVFIAPGNHDYFSGADESAEFIRKTQIRLLRDEVITLPNGAKIGGGNFLVIAGPCSVENEEQIITSALSVKAAGAQVLRGGAFKPRTSPYAFQGMKGEGIQLLLKAKKETGLPIVTEIMNISTLDLFNDIDIIQVGARNMQNFDLLKELGKTNKPILLKRGLANTLQELLMSAEYIMSEGNENVILCERGIRTFETYTRNTLDLSAVSVLHELSHLPVIVDPSHATGKSKLVPPMALAAKPTGIRENSTRGGQCRA